MTDDTALVERPGAVLTPVVITEDQITLIKTTIAKDATNDELALFFYDCRRRGVHPLDKLIHLTKRVGKYTPVTSIDFFRARAAETREHMGTDDAAFAGTPKSDGFLATVTVYRKVQGEKCAFTATARWVEYCPDKGYDFMWQKMPHGQLGKCAEALALRKGFPQELADLHTWEEMEQAFGGPGNGTTEPPKKEPQRASVTSGTGKVDVKPEIPTELSKPTTIQNVQEFKTSKGDPIFQVSTAGQDYSLFDAKIAAELKSFVGTDHQVILRWVLGRKGDKTYHNIVSFAVAEPTETPAPGPCTAPPEGDVRWS